ncbi:hypothetical protein N7925_14765 [Streptomyces sp. CA-278952]|uniref:hypothetical protein n=1 Tax=Streptomyces sp. CA-278952 TaxID=2980556 RepID=UPI0023684A1C|nr:hypothetical protein [Streptomyces sp. CA-278952]WDG29523.1 hypothetical protein N7925_14765 [Streptomyces sp. CA-278952]
MPDFNLLLRPIFWGAALVTTALVVTGCSNGESPLPDSSVTAPASVSTAPSSAPSAPTAAEVSQEPSPVISYLGKTKVVTLGDTEVRATRDAIGIRVACNATNKTDLNHNIRVTVSIGNGTDWVQTTKFEFKQIAPGQIGRESVLMGDAYEGVLPDDPKIYIDSVIYY